MSEIVERGNPPKSEAPIPDRLTVVETVYHRSIGQEPSMFDSRFSRELKTRDQPYGPRRLVATEKWALVDLGWVKSAGMIVVRNEEGQHLQANPTEQERAETRRKVLEIAWQETVDNPEIEEPSNYSWLVPPGESFRGYPACSKLLIRCRSGNAKYTLFVVPE